MRRAAFVCAMVATASAASAQGIEYGVKAGMVLADLRSDEEDANLASRVGFVGGGFLTWPLAGRLALQPEALFTQKGATFDESGGTGSINLDYLDVPLLLTYRVSGSPGRGLSLFGGPAVGLRLRARSRATFGDDSLDQDVSEFVKGSDVAIVGGVSYQLGRLSLDGRYSWGLSDIDDLEADDAKVRNRGIGLLAGWRF